ncbi:MAG: discoidin domain-containing protein [Phycisphaerae bacterium]|nr:discoidin domain-containing protein [Phycisphaerae bacterium]
MRSRSNPPLWPVLLVSLAIVSVSYGDLTNIAPIYGVASADAHGYGPDWGGPIDSWLPGNAIDGATGPVNDWTTGWSAGSHGTPSNPHWLVVDLQNAYPVGQITVFGLLWEDDPYFGYTNVYNLYTSTDAANWTLIASDWWAEDTDASIYSDTYMLSGDPLRYVKYEVVGGTHWADVQEIMTFADVSAVPLPGAVLLGAIGLSCAGWRLRRKTT